jgi:Bacterial pre-peptidase C-terminal domain
MHRIQPLSRFVPVLFAGLALLALADSAPAQQQGSNLPAPRLFTVNPPGGKIGSTVEVAFTGTDLEEPDQLIFSHPGIKADPIIPPEPKPDPKKPPMPNAKPNVTKFKVTIASSVPVGFHDVRLVNKWGVSNPRTFAVGDLDEVLEVEPNNDVPQAQKVALNTTINGSMANPTDVDYYVFPAKKGQRVIISCLASSIDSRFHPGLQLFDSRNKLLAENRNYHDHDALIDWTVQEDGDHYVRLFEFTHTLGTPEYFYRLSISTGPWIDAVFPNVVEPGKPTQVTIHGRNLPGGQPDPAAVLDGVVLEKITHLVNPPANTSATTFLGHITPAMANIDGFELRVKNAVGSSNAMFLAYGRAPVVLEKEPNDTPETAQEIAVPCELCGRIDKSRDRDWYAFTAKKGDVLVFDLFSDRLGVDSDAYFILRSADGKQTFVEQDDNADFMSMKFYARTDDPAPYRFAVPADGKYLLAIGSRTSSILFGPRHVYRMRIAPEHPDFRLVVMASDSYRPGASTLLKGGNETFTVFAWRQDGFTGDIALSVEGLPKGVTCPPQVMGGGLRHVKLVLSGAADAAPWTGEIKLLGTATIGGKPVVHEARPGGILWPIQQGQNFPRVSRLERGLALAVRGQAPYTLTATIDKPQAAPGTTAIITVKLTRLWPDFKTPLAVTLAQAQGGQSPPATPQGLTVAQANIAPAATEAKMNVTIPANIPPGTYNIVLSSTAQIPFNKDPAAKQKPNTVVVQSSSPVSLTIIPKSLANLTLSAPQVNAKIGMKSEVVVRVARQFNFAGEFKVQVVLPPGVQGVTIADATIPAGQNEVKLIIDVPAGAAPGNRQNLTVKATAMFDKTPIVHETKLSVNVTK